MIQIEQHLRFDREHWRLDSVARCG